MELHGNVAQDIWGPTCNVCMINSGDPMQFVLLGPRLNLAERRFMQTYYRSIRRICRYCLHNIIYNSHMAMVEIHLSWSFNLRQSRLCISYHFLPVEDRLLAKLPMRRL